MKRCSVAAGGRHLWSRHTRRRLSLCGCVALGSSILFIPTEKLKQYHLRCRTEYWKTILLSTRVQSERSRLYVHRPVLENDLKQHLETNSSNDDNIIHFLVGPQKSGKKALVCGTMENTFLILDNNRFSNASENKDTGHEEGHPKNLISSFDEIYSSLPVVNKFFWVFSSCILKARKFFGGEEMEVDPNPHSSHYIGSLLSTL